MAYDRGPRGRKRRKVCSFCVDKVQQIDYKDTAKLHQRQLTVAIKRARQIALLPYVAD